MKILALLILVSTAFAQEHAPTPEQCRADYRLWTVKGTDVSDIAWKELMQRSLVMSKCSTTDPEWMQQFAEQNLRLGEKSGLSYSALSMFLHAAAGEKTRDFLERHHLMAQFTQEDEAGKHNE